MYGLANRCIAALPPYRIYTLSEESIITSDTIILLSRLRDKLAISHKRDIGRGGGNRTHTKRCCKPLPLPFSHTTSSLAEAQGLEPQARESESRMLPVTPNPSKIGRGCRSRTYIFQGQSLAHSPVMITPCKLVGRRGIEPRIALGFNQPLYH